MIEFFRSFFRTAEDRLNNPIVGAVVVSWTIWNWKSIAFFVLSNAEVYYRINFIKEAYSYPFLLDVFIPIFLALIYVSLLPYVTQGVDYITLRAVRAAIRSERDKKIYREAVDERSTVENLTAQLSASESERVILLRRNTELENETTENKNELERAKKALAESAVNYEKEMKSREQFVIGEIQRFREKIEELNQEIEHRQSAHEKEQRELQLQYDKLFARFQEIQHISSIIVPALTPIANEISEKNFTQVGELVQKLKPLRDAGGNPLDESYKGFIEEMEEEMTRLESESSAVLCIRDLEHLSKSDGI